MVQLIKNNNEKLASNKSVFLLDLLISTAASLFALLLVRWVSEPFYGFQSYIVFSLLLSIMASALSFYLLKSYRMVIRYTSFFSVGRLVSSSFLKVVILSITAVLGLAPESPVRIKIFTLLLDLLLTGFLLVFVRLLILQTMKSVSSNMDEMIGKLRVLVYGTTEKSIAMVTGLYSSSHYDIIGFVTVGNENEGSVIFRKKVYSCASKEKLMEMCGSLGVDAVLFVDANSEYAKQMVAFCMETGVTILNSPRLENMVPHVVKSEDVKALRVDTTYIKDGMTDVGRAMKRIMDFSVSALCLVIFSPLFLIVYLAIKHEDGGPAIYTQERIGRFGRPFVIYKFRSMRLDAEAAGPALYAGDTDPRLTKVGAFIRAHHLDELPQLWNVFRGDMAFVGYRPERQFYIEQIMEKDQRYQYLYQMRPGVTSYATLFYGYTDTLEKMLKRLEYDLYYLRNRSVWFDAKILFMTFMSIVFGKKF